MKLLIFDFDGTIVDSKNVYYRAIEKHLLKRGFTRKEIDSAIDFGLSLKGILKRLEFSFIDRFLIKRRIMRDVIEDINKVKKCTDVDFIKNINCKKILITNSLKSFVYPVLKHLKINYFSEIYGADDFEDKSEFIKKYLKKHNISKEDCYYIGDRVADIEVANKVGCISIIISNKCSWDRRNEIKKACPDFILFDIKDIKEVIPKP